LGSNNDISPPYETMGKKLEIVKKNLNRPLSLAEKILYSHLVDPNCGNIVRGQTYLKLTPGKIEIEGKNS